MKKAILLSMKSEMGKATKERKKQKTRHDDIGGDSNSTNNQSQSSESHVSHIGDSTKIDSSSRRASLRSSKRKNLIETGITDSSSLQFDDQSQSSECAVAEGNIDKPSLAKVMEDIFGCEKEFPLVVKPISMDVGSPSFSQKQTIDMEVHQDNKLESRECSLSNNGQHFIQNPFEVVAAGIASSKRPIETGMTDFPESRKHSSATHAIQNDLAYQVPSSSQMESPSRYLKQGEPSLRREEIEKGENFVAEENLGDAIAVPQQEMMEEVGEKEVSLIDISTVSLKLNELLNIVVDEDDEVDSQRCAIDKVEGYVVKPEFMDMLGKILTKYGDIVKNCTVSTVKFRSALLEMICGIISELQGKDLIKKIKKDVLHNNINLVDEIKNMDVNIEWLRSLLIEMLEAKQELIGEKFGKLKEKKDSDKKTVEDAETKLTECQERKKELEALLKSTSDEEFVCKEALANAKDESAKTTQAIKCAISKVERFLNGSAVNDLL